MGLVVGALRSAENSSRAPELRGAEPWAHPALCAWRSSRGRAQGCDEGGAARRRRASRQGGRAAVSGSASGWRPQSLAAGGKRSGAGCGGSEGCGLGAGRLAPSRATPLVHSAVAIASPASPRYAPGSLCCGSSGAEGWRPARSACLRVGLSTSSGESGCIRDGLLAPGNTRQHHLAFDHQGLCSTSDVLLVSAQQCLSRPVTVRRVQTELRPSHDSGLVNRGCMSMHVSATDAAVELKQLHRCVTVRRPASPLPSSVLV